MKLQVVIVTCTLHPEPIVSAQTSAQIAEKMTALGHQVKVLAPFPSRPTRKAYPQYTRKLLQREANSPGYEIIRLFSFYSSASTFLSRFLENISFGLSVFFVLLLSRRADVVYGNTWPIFAQGLLVLACKLRCMPLVLSVQDVYPESLIAQGRMDKGTIFRFLRWLDILIAKNCHSLIVISEKFKKVYAQDRGIQKEKIHVIPNWIDPDRASVDNQYNSIRLLHDIPTGAFLVVYGGNIGVAAGVIDVIQAFSYLLEKENIYLLLAGDGSRLSECKGFAEENKLTRVKFHNPWLEQETYAVLETANLLILPTHGKQAYASVPSKLLSYMLSGRCILAIAPLDSEVAEVISSSGAGWVVPPADGQSLAMTIIQISESLPEDRNNRGLLGRAYLIQHYSKEDNLGKVVKVLEMKNQ
jgi:colanic acid biosynthesis glycosyl transferase WcaI